MKIAFSYSDGLRDFAIIFIDEVRIHLPNNIEIDEIKRSRLKLVEYDYTNMHVIRFGKNKLGLFYDYWSNPLVTMAYHDPKCSPKIIVDEIKSTMAWGIKDREIKYRG